MRKTIDKTKLYRQDYINPTGDIKVTVKLLNDPLSKWNAVIICRYKDEYLCFGNKVELLWTKRVLFSNSNSFNYMMRRGKIYIQNRFKNRLR